MTTLDDKILGEKTHNYCSSSEDEGDSDNESDCGNSKTNIATKARVQEPPPIDKWNGTATNTGPKGVIEDWRRFKQLESEHRVESDRERIELMKKLSISCRSEREEEKAKKRDELDEELDELLNDDFLFEYQQQRMGEILAQIHAVPNFGSVVELKTSDEFLEAIDKENKFVTVIIHVYDNKLDACRTMDGCLKVLTREYSNVKFCRINAAVAGLSKKFKLKGLPALLVYKGGQMIGNFIKISDELGDDFFAVNLESYLLEHSLLPDKKLLPPVRSQ